MAGHVFRGSLMFGIVMILVAGGPAAGQDTASNDEHRAQPLWLAYNRGNYEIAEILSEYRATLG